MDYQFAVDAVDFWIRVHNEDLVAYTADLIGIDSQIPPRADERAIVAHLASTLVAGGIADIDIVGPTRERPSLIARLPGSGDGPTLMLCGHVDTKPIGEAHDLWRTPPHEATIRDGLMYGLGSNDMKAGVAAMVFAALAIRATGTTLRGDLVLGLVADEENGSGAGAKYVAPLLRGGVDAALIGEPSGWSRDWEGIHLVSRGVCCFRIVVNGTQRHSSLSDRLPSVNASLKAAHLLIRIADDLDLPFVPHPLGGVGPTLNPGVLLSGGTYFGVIPGQAEFACDLRTVPGMTLETTRDALERWLDECRRADPELDVEVVFEPGLEWIPWSELDEHHPLVSSVERASAAVLDAAPPRSVFPGGSDAPWFAQAGIPTLPSFGPGMLTSAHGPNEFVSVRSIGEAARMYARAVLDYVGVA